MTARSTSLLLRNAALLAALLACTAVNASQLQQQRELFRQAYPQAELGNWSAIESLTAAERRSLEDYVLWPDLRAAYLKSTIRKADDDEVRAFLEQYGTLKPARELRYRYALQLARSGRMQDYLEIYQSFYQGIAMPKLDCLALQAELEQGRDRRVVNRAVDLWLVGRSQVDECDPVFAWVKDNEGLGADEYRQRFDLAIEARQFSLARWLAKSIDAQHVDVASRWIRAQNNPSAFIRETRRQGNDSTARAQLVYAVERLTYNDPIVADELWRDIRGRYDFSEQQRYATERHIALWMARDQLPGAYEALHALPLGAVDDEVARWRARSSLRRGSWDTLLADIELLSETERASEEWRYWQAIALQQSGDDAAAEATLTLLATERSYYGFLAADAIGAPYHLDSSMIAVDERLLQQLEARPAVLRARELFFTGLEGRGRSEWQGVLTSLSDGEKRQAAVLADRWGWHSRAIATAASVGFYDDLEMRYPLAFKDAFLRSSEQASIPSTWAYGIARSESLFMRDIRSSAGAIGLMQLMPATGKEVARSLKLPYSGLATLTDADANIRLGTTYLSQMAERYGGNRVAATAAYNAGPHRVDAWLPEQGSLDARIWIENIPFNETRKYVRRVLTAETIFHWRMTGEVRRLSEALPAMYSRDDPQRLARR
jgi:soluble lytic murein transglycosylase